MPTKQAKPPAHLEGARSALAKRGFRADLNKRGYTIATGRRLPVGHPLVAAFPDYFEPSGEAHDADPQGRDLDPPPKPTPAATRIAYRAVCAEDPPCGWEQDTASEAKAAAIVHWHAP